MSREQDAIEFIKIGQEYRDKYGDDGLKELLKSTTDFFGLTILAYPEKEFDAKDLEKYKKRNNTPKELNTSTIEYKEEKDDNGLFGYVNALEEKLKNNRDNINNSSVEASPLSSMESRKIYDERALPSVLEDLNSSREKLVEDHSYDEIKSQTENLDIENNEHYEEELLKPHERVLTKSSNAWESAGDPISPGTINL